MGACTKEEKRATPWNDAIFKLIEYRSTLESLMNPDAEVFDMAVYAMKKQAPRKPRIIPDWTGITDKYFCPACMAYFGTCGKRNIPIFSRPDYCNCGQALDWTMEE